MSAVNWDMWGALGSILASFVAFFIAFLPSIQERLNAPKLKLVFENGEPYCRIVHEKHADGASNSDINAYYMRIKVINTGKTTARDCKGKIVEIKKMNGEELQPFDPTTLRWSWQQTGTIQLTRGEYDYLNVIKVYENKTNNLHILNDANIPKGVIIHPAMDDYTITISISGENFPPVMKSYKITKNDSFNKVQLNEID